MGSIRNAPFRVRTLALALLTAGAAVLGIGMGTAVACGGFFCQSAAVDQAGERIVFTVNDDGTITSLVEIQYQGSAEDFSWILPIPEAIGVDDLQVPDDGQDVFTELHTLTDVQFIPPTEPECTQLLRYAAVAESDMPSDDADVEIFASGEVGPFGFDVIGSEDPDALVSWLRDNNYDVEPSMEPLIQVYVDEEMAFIAMRLLDGEDANSITPIEITYPGTQPMIPLRLTAVAALDDMPIFAWIFGDTQAVPSNFAAMRIETAELTFGPFGANDYRRLVADRADANNGQAFITEFAGPGSSLAFEHPYLKERADRYLTRLFSVISPHEMTLDPMFHFENLPDVSNVRDASQLTGLYDCERFPFGDDLVLETSDALDPRDGGDVVVAQPVSFEGAPIVSGEDDTAATATPESGAAAPAFGDELPTDDSTTGTWLAVIGIALAVLIGLGLAVPMTRRAD